MVKRNRTKRLTMISQVLQRKLKLSNTKHTKYGRWTHALQKRKQLLLH